MHVIQRLFKKNYYWKVKMKKYLKNKRKLKGLKIENIYEINT